MVKRSNNFENHLLLGENQNKYTVLEEVTSFLGSNKIYWNRMLELFRKSQYGRLDFDFGEIEVSFTVFQRFHDDVEHNGWIELEVAFLKEDSRKQINYEYKISELRKIRMA